MLKFMVILPLETLSFFSRSMELWFFWNMYVLVLYYCTSKKYLLQNKIGIMASTPTSPTSVDLCMPVMPYFSS